MSEAQGKLVFLFTRDMGNGDSYTIEHPLGMEHWSSMSPDERYTFVSDLVGKYREPYADCNVWVEVVE